MEKSTSDYTRQIDELTNAKVLSEEEKTRLMLDDSNWGRCDHVSTCRLNEQLEGLKKEMKELPTLQDLNRLALGHSISVKIIPSF